MQACRRITVQSEYIEDQLVDHRIWAEGCKSRDSARLRGKGSQIQ